MKILTVPTVKQEIRRLQNFINLVESYEANTLEKWIIKEYAYTSSIREVVLRGNEKGFTVNGRELENEYVKSIIASPPIDELHKIVRANYRLRTKHTRKR